MRQVTDVDWGFERYRVYRQRSVGFPSQGGEIGFAVESFLKFRIGCTFYFLASLKKIVSNI
jgi:hypothetical protein